MLERQVGVRLSMQLSTSSSRSRFTTETEAPAYLLRHLKNVALLTPCRRSKSATGTPDSASLSIPTIWLSLNFDVRMITPEPGAVCSQLSTHRGSLRCPVIACMAQLPLPLAPHYQRLSPHRPHSATRVASATLSVAWASREPVIGLLAPSGTPGVVVVGMARTTLSTPTAVHMSRVTSRVRDCRMASPCRRMNHGKNVKRTRTFQPASTAVISGFL